MSTGFAPRTIHLSSKYVTSQNITYDPTNSYPIKYAFQLSQAITLPQEYELFVSVLSASVPYTWYGVNYTNIGYVKNNNIMPWGSYNKTNNLYSGNIPAGNYSPTDLINLMGGNLQTANVDINISFSTITGLFTFTNISNGNISLNPSPIFGITQSGLTLNGINSTATAQTFPEIFGTRYINIVSSLATNNITAGVAPKGGGSVLLAFPVSNVPFNLISITPNNLLKNRLKESTINCIEISICDSNLTPLNLNSAAFEIDLLVECVIPPSMPQNYSEEPQGISIYALNRNYKFG